MPGTPVYLKRWQVVTAFAFNVVAIVILAILLQGNINSNRGALVRLSRDKASIGALERSNCRIKEFLVSAAKFRRRQAAAETSPKRRAADLRAARTSAKLASAESNELCPG